VCTNYFNSPYDRETDGWTGRGIDRLMDGEKGIGIDKLRGV